MDPQEVQDTLQAALQAAGFDMRKPSPRTAWNVFKRVFDMPLEGANGLLFECGTYGFSGPKEYTLSFVRQIEIPGNDEYVQVHLELKRPPSEDTKDLKKNLWSFEYATPGKYFDAVEGLAEFQRSITLDGWRCEIWADET